MSDPVTNVEVEDVLSSIRRLVSDDKRPSITTATAPLNDRLVLTPALRVAQDDNDADSTVTKSEPETEFQAWSTFGTSPESTNTDHDVVEPAHTQETDGDSAEQGAQDEILGDIIDEADDDEAKSDPFVLEPSQESQIEVRAEELVKEFTLGALETEVPNAELDKEQDQDQGEAEFFANNAATLGAKIAALETVIGKTDDQWEPDDTGDSDYSGTEAPAMVWDDVDGAETANVEAATSSDRPDMNAESEAGLGVPIDSVLDEEALRDLVSDIVREELQGALGERITRNVRKLVRREIHRALAAQELE
jgi:hypothetical protein